MAKRVELYLRLREKGMTYEEIGELFGVSKQCVYETIHRGTDNFHKASVLKVKYVGLRNWMLDNRVNIGELEKRVGGQRLHTALKVNGNPRKDTIDKILAATGLTYEECFRED